VLKREVTCSSANSRDRGRCSSLSALFRCASPKRRASSHPARASATDRRAVTRSAWVRWMLPLDRHEPAPLVVGGPLEPGDSLLFGIPPRHPCGVELHTREPALSQQIAQLRITRPPGSKGHRQPCDHEVLGVGLEGGGARLIHVDDVHRASEKEKASGAGPKALHESQATHPAATSS
jgi:hypothetical protein